MLEPKEITIDGKNYTIHKIPAVAGRELLMRYPVSNIPKVGEYGESVELMRKLMKFVVVKTPEGREIALETDALIDNHVPNARVLLKLEKEMLDYNFGFFSNGEISRFFQAFEKVAMRKVIEILTRSSAQLSKAGKPL